MTHDPREALEPCPFCGSQPSFESSDSGCIIKCTDDGCWLNQAEVFEWSDDDAARRWNTRALTASPGEQKPVAWQRWHPSNGWTDCRAEDVEHYKRFSKVRPLYTSPPPAAGWDEALITKLSDAYDKVKLWPENRIDGGVPEGFDDIFGDFLELRNLIPEAVKAIRREAPAPEGVAKAEFPAWTDEDKAYELGRRDGYELAVQDIDLATGGDGEFKGSTIPGETVDVPAMKQRIIGRFAADKSAEARLREALDENRALRAANTKLVLAERERLEALSLVGDEAKKSEGGLPDWDDFLGIAPNATGDLSSEAFIREQRDSWDDKYSDPSPDRREIVARLRKLIATATLLYQNAVGCAANHHSVDFEQQGLPGWLADCERDIRAASAALDGGR